MQSSNAWNGFAFEYAVSLLTVPACVWIGRPPASTTPVVVPLTRWMAPIVDGPKPVPYELSLIE